MAASLDPSVIAALGPLLGTLQGQDALTSLQAQQDAQQQAVLDQAAQAAQQGAQQAQGAYQGMAAAPPPQVDSFLPQLLSNFASVLSENPSYAANRRNQLTGQQSDLMEARRNNLTSLRDIYEQKAQAAHQAGQMAEAEKARQSHERVSVQLQKMKDQADLERQLELERRKGVIQTGIEAMRLKRQEERDAAKAAADEKKAAAKASAEGTDYFDSLVKTTRNGSQFLDMTAVPPKDKHNLLVEAAKRGVVPADKGTADRLGAAEEVYSNFDEIERVMKSFLPKTPGERFLKAPLNELARITQSNEDIGSFGNTQLAAIRNIQALASGIGSGFRLNEQEIKRAIANFPKITDTYAVAARKLEWERNFLRNKERVYMQQDWRKSLPGAATSVPAPTAAKGDTLGLY